MPTRLSKRVVGYKFTHYRISTEQALSESYCELFWKRQRCFFSFPRIYISCLEWIHILRAYTPHNSLVVVQCLELLLMNKQLLNGTSSGRKCNCGKESQLHQWTVHYCLSCWRNNAVIAVFQLNQTLCEMFLVTPQSHKLLFPVNILVSKCMLIFSCGECLIHFCFQCYT